MDDLRLSRRHAELEYDGKRILIRDLGSMNGVLVDGDRINGIEYLSDGAHITMGPFTFTLRLAADEKDPSRVASEAIAQQEAARSTPSNDFTPSTDRANRQTVDSGQGLPVPTPAPKPHSAPVGGKFIVKWSLSRPHRASPQFWQDRRIAPLIEEALKEDEDPLKPLPSNEPHIVTEMLMPSQENSKPKSEALLPLDDQGKEIVHSEEQLRLNPLAVEDAHAGIRLGAMAGAMTMGMCIFALCSLIGFGIGLLIPQAIAGSDETAFTTLGDQLSTIRQAGFISWLSLIVASGVGLMLGSGLLVMALWGQAA